MNVYKHSCVQQITFVTYDFVQQQNKHVRAMFHFYFLFHRGPNVSKSRKWKIDIVEHFIVDDNFNDTRSINF